MNKKEKLETLLNSLIERGRSPRNKEKVALISIVGDQLRLLEADWSIYTPYSPRLRELVSLESWLWQFATKMRMHRENLYEDYEDELLDYEENIVNFSWEQKIRDDHWFTIQTVNKARLSSYQYRLIESALVPEEELAQFLLDNIKVEWKKE